MPFWKPKPKRLYIPVKARWYTRPKGKGALKPRNAVVLQKRGMVGLAKDWAKRSVPLAIGSVLVGGLIFILSVSSYFSVKEIQVERENLHIDSAKIENKLNVFLGRNLVFFPPQEIRAMVAKEFPEFSEVETKKVFPSTLKVKLVSQPIVSNLKAYYLLPAAEEPLPEDFTQLNQTIQELDPSSSDPSEAPEAPKPANSAFDLTPDDENEGPKPTEQKALLNRIGQAIFDQEENLELMTIVVRGLTQPIEDRKFVVSPKTMDYLLEAVRYCGNALGLEIAAAEFNTVANEIHLRTKSNLWIWLSVDRDYQEQIDKLKIVYEPAGLNKEDLSYVDLRVKGKVIYCLRHAKCDKIN